MRKNKNTYTRTCEICGKEFTATRSDARFCSPQCRVKSRRMAEKELLKKYCEEEVKRVRYDIFPYLDPNANIEVESADGKTFSLLIRDDKMGNIRLKVRIEEIDKK